MFTDKLEYKNKVAHIFLTGYSLKNLNNFDIIKDSDFVISSNLSILHEYIAKRTNAYYIATSYNILYWKITHLCIKLALANVNKDCVFYLKKKYIKYVNNFEPDRMCYEIDIKYTFLARFNEIINIKSTTQYTAFHIINKLGFKKVYLWGADYIFEKPVHTHFYNYSYKQEKSPDQEVINVYQYIREKFKDLTIIQVCPVNSKSYIFETINVK